MAKRSKAFSSKIFISSALVSGLKYVIDVGMETQSPQILATPEAYALLTDPSTNVRQEAILDEVMRLIRAPQKSDAGFAGGIFGGTPFRLILLWAKEAHEKNIFVLSTNFYMDYPTRAEVRRGNHNYVPISLS